MELSKDIIGREFKKFSYRVDANKVKEFCLAIGETNPIYFDSKLAVAKGFADIPVPPTFLTVVDFWGYPSFLDDSAILGIDAKRLLHMKEEYHYYQAIYVGNLIQVILTVKDVKIGKMNMVTFEHKYNNNEGETCAKADMTIVIRP